MMAMQDTANVPTPELDKQHAILDQARVLTDFWDWLHDDQGLRLAKYETRPVEEPCNGPSPFDRGTPKCRRGRIWINKWLNKADAPDGVAGYHYVDDNRDCTRCDGRGWEMVEREGYYEDHRTPEQLFADYFGIDRDKIEAERRALLEAIRS